MPFITTKSSKEEKGLKKKQKTNKQTITNIVLYTDFLTKISNHHFHQIYTGHRFPHPIPKRCCLFLGLDLINCPNYFAFD